MSDDGFGEEEGERNGGRGGTTQLTRYSRVTDALDAVFDLLCVPRRRYLLYYLYEIEGDVVDTDDAIDAVCAYEARGTERDGFPPREDVLIDLHHDHVPRLADAGVVEYDRRQGTIRFRGSAPLEEWLEHAGHLELD